MKKKFIKTCLFTFLVSFLFQPFLYADIYMYKDKNGAMHFTNDPSAKNSKKYQFFIPETEKVRALPKADLYDDIILQAAKTHNVEADLIKAVMHIESAFNPKAVSKKGAKGLMQLMPATAKSMGVSNPFQPGENILGGARYLRLMLDMFDGNVECALAAYHAGPAHVIKNNGVPPFKGTRAYIDKVNQYRKLYKHTNSVEISDL